MRSNQRRFRGSLRQLQAIVAASNVSGVWEDMAGGFVRFVANSGALLNWWPQTGTFNFQGPLGAAAELETVIAAAVASGTLSARLAEAGRS